MDMEVLSDTLAEVRQAIDALDSQRSGVRARRQQGVAQAGRLKPKHDAQAVAAPERVTQVLKARREQAAVAGLSPDVAEAVWQAMIAAFIRFEQEVNRSGGASH